MHQATNRKPYSHQWLPLRLLNPRKRNVDWDLLCLSKFANPKVCPHLFEFAGYLTKEQSESWRASRPGDEPWKIEARLTGHQGTWSSSWLSWLHTLLLCSPQTQANLWMSLLRLGWMHFPWSRVPWNPLRGAPQCWVNIVPRDRRPVLVDLSMLAKEKLAKGFTKYKVQS